MTDLSLAFSFPDPAFLLRGTTLRTPLPFSPNPNHNKEHAHVKEARQQGTRTS